MNVRIEPGPLDHHICATITVEIDGNVRRINATQIRVAACRDRRKRSIALADIGVAGCVGVEEVAAELRPSA
jgi:hypothetical protein